VSVELNPALLPPGVLGSPQAAPTTKPVVDTGGISGPSFADVLKGATGEAGADKQGAAAAGSTEPAAAAGSTEPLHFSKHALERVQRRGIALDPSTLGRLHEGVGRAAGKGSRDSLVMVDDTAFVVSVPNRTVITAVGSEHMREHIFTNIDSAVIA
jgi:flagellar operon protein